MTPSDLDYLLMLATTVDPASAQEAREAIVSLVVEVRRLSAEVARLRVAMAEHSPTDPAPVPDDAPTSELPDLHGSFAGSLSWDGVDDDDGDPEGCA